MSTTRRWLRPAFASFVIAHGLSHSVLPLRGFMDPAMLDRDFFPVILFGTAILGFVAAGIGVFGVRPFTAVTRPSLVLASGYSLVALWRFGLGDLWWGAAIDVVLLLVGLTGAHRYLPAAGESRSRLRHALGVACATAFIAYATCAAVLWPLHRAWGSLAQEHLAALPGDPPDRNRALEVQHAITIDAAPDAVWPWLVQLGQDRAGFYSYDWLERVFGVEVRNVYEIRPEWQTRQTGDRVRAAQDGYLGGMLGKDLGWTVNELDPGRALVLQNWGAFVLQFTPEGQTRFIIRTKVGDEKTPVWAAAMDMMSFQLAHFIMERRMMVTIKSLAERGSPGRQAVRQSGNQEERRGGAS